MDLLRSHLHKVCIPKPGSRIHKDECFVSFDTPRSEGGLYVDMTSFLGFGRNPVYLHIMQRRKPEPDDEADHPLKKPTLLSIGSGAVDESGVWSCTSRVVSIR
ncbi:hypothetical protein OsI_14584 [Oryza sativa Indica Group]|uniref:Ubiquitinyl hydrolase variant UBP zinc finger domain-containing protein n=1 Tax=Oryza sativa subsp. indica TaxID=39946 RepID=A2XPM0_ORYSI|nr:hypothetical protein OsI_14584 [Oryza sativa Indica Group]